MRRTPIALAAAGTVAALAVVAFAIGLPRTGSEPSAPPAPVPSFSHVYVIVLENHDLKDVLASSQTPFLGSLVERYGVAGAYTSIAHPSQPNYLALFSGSTQSVTDNGAHDIDAPSLADQLETHGQTGGMERNAYRRMSGEVERSRPPGFEVVARIRVAEVIARSDEVGGR